MDGYPVLCVLNPKRHKHEKNKEKSLFVEVHILKFKFEQIAEKLWVVRVGVLLSCLQKTDQLHHEGKKNFEYRIPGSNW